jgi:hypothetical protein
VEKSGQASQAFVGSAPIFSFNGLSVNITLYLNEVRFHIATPALLGILINSFVDHPLSLIRLAKSILDRLGTRD